MDLTSTSGWEREAEGKITDGGWITSFRSQIWLAKYVRAGVAVNHDSCCSVEGSFLFTVAHRAIKKSVWIIFSGKTRAMEELGSFMG